MDLRNDFAIAAYRIAIRILSRINRAAVVKRASITMYRDANMLANQNAYDSDIQWVKSSTKITVPVDNIKIPVTEIMKRPKNPNAQPSYTYYNEYSFDIALHARLVFGEIKIVTNQGTYVFSLSLAFQNAGSPVDSCVIQDVHFSDALNPGIPINIIPGTTYAMFEKAYNTL